MKNAILYYYNQNNTIDCLLIIFGLVFKISINAIGKKRVFKIGIYIFFKFIDN